MVFGSSDPVRKTSLQNLSSRRSSRLLPDSLQSFSMDQPSPSTNSAGASAALIPSAALPNDNFQPPQPQLPYAAAPVSAGTTQLPASANPSPAPMLSTPLTSQAQTSQPHSSQHQSRPPSLTRPWNQPPQPSATLTPPPQRGGMALGLPAHQGGTLPQPSAFSSSYLGQQYGGLGRGTGSTPESISSHNPSQMRPSMPGIHGVGMMGSGPSGSHIRPGGIHQPRPLQQPSLRPPAPSTSQSPSQSFQGHGLLRGTSVGSLMPSSSSNSLSTPSPNQPWLSSASQGKPPVPPPSFRPQMSAQPIQQRSHIPQQLQPSLPAPSPQQQISSSIPSQQPSLSTQSQEQHMQQSLPPRPTLPPQPLQRVQGSANQRTSPTVVQQQPSTALKAANAKTAGSEEDEPCSRIISKRSISEILNQTDPSEKLEPEVEDILVDIAEEFVDSITKFGCSLAKHRKSSTLEAKDILLHLEKNWNMTLPGFSGDEVKSFRKPVTNEIHRERLAAIKKSIVVAEAASNKNTGGHMAGNAKGNLGKTASANIVGSPNMKSL